MKRKHLRLPNGFGQITKISGNLRKPYRCMATVGKDEFGKPICKLLKPVSYFATYTEAFEALLANNKNPYDPQSDMTLAEAYEEWSKEAFKYLSKSMVEQYKMAWKCCNLKTVQVRLIRPKHIRDCVTQPDLSDAKSNLVKVLLNNVFDYTTENEISEKNYARLTKIHRDEEYYKVKKSHNAFTEEEIRSLWDNINNSTAQLILILCYTGMRPRELLAVKLSDVHFHDMSITAGSKTKAGKNRKIPIHPTIYDIVRNIYEQSFASGSDYLVNKNGDQMSYDTLRRRLTKLCSDLNISEHTGHDGRKTFITLAKKYHVDEYAIKRIVGHEITDLTEKVYTERSFDWITSEIRKILYE